MRKIKLGISACLLGEKVRYDGQHKHDHYLTDVLGQIAVWTPVCPEAGCGLPIPREAMHLAGDIDNPRLVTVRSGIDHTERMRKWAETKLDELESEHLCGFVFKSNSPSSGRFNVKVFNAHGVPAKKGVGIFARMFNARFPLIPQEEEGRLHDPLLRENFIDKIFAFDCWREYESSDGSAAGLVDFHTRHKYTLMSHSPEKLRELGRIVAAADRRDMAAVRARYLQGLMAALDLRATPRKNRNTMQHIMGYFKRQLTGWEKQELIEAMDQYVNGITPKLTPLTLLRHYARKYAQSYLLEQRYLTPSAAELTIKYHL